MLLALLNHWGRVRGLIKLLIHSSALPGWIRVSCQQWILELLSFLRCLSCFRAGWLWLLSSRPRLLRTLSPCCALSGPWRDHAVPWHNLSWYREDSKICSWKVSETRWQGNKASLESWHQPMEWMLLDSSVMDLQWVSYLGVIDLAILGKHPPSAWFILVFTD